MTKEEGRKAGHGLFSTFWRRLLTDRYRSEGSRLTKSLDKKPIEHLIFSSLSLSLSVSLTLSHFLYLDLNRSHFDTRGSHLVSQFLLWSSLSIRAIAKFRRFIFFHSLKSFDLLDIYLYFPH